jgi:hypothetical protein
VQKHDECSKRIYSSEMFQWEHFTLLRACRDVREFFEMENVPTGTLNIRWRLPERSRSSGEAKDLPLHFLQVISSLHLHQTKHM